MEKYENIQKIVIVDNYSEDGSYELLKEIENDKIDVILSYKNGGYAFGNNFGLKYLDEKYGENVFDYVIISNSDVSVEEKNIDKCIDELEVNKNACIVAPRMWFKRGPARRSAWKKRTYVIDIASSTRFTQAIMFYFFKKGEYSKREFEKDEKMKVFAIAGSFFVARTSMFREVGYFDDNTFLFMEEDILGDKLEAKGYDIISLNNCHFMHYESQTIGRLNNAYKKMDMLFESKIYYHKKYNNVSDFGILIFKILKQIRKFEILIEKTFRK